MYSLFERSEKGKTMRQLQVHMRNYKFPQADPTVHRDLQHGWLIPYLIKIDELTWGRWDYWARTSVAGKLLDEPIPEVEFSDTPDPRTKSMIEGCLNNIQPGTNYQGWSGWERFNYMLDWLLFGFGYAGQKEAPKEPAGAQGASDRLYQMFVLDALMLYPADYWGDLLAESKHGQHNGFYPTPMHIVQLMFRMQMQDLEAEDLRTKTIYDPCLGTGRFLMLASNYSLRCYGQDIDLTVLKAAVVNFYIYCPWIVKPFAFLNDNLSAEEKAEAHERMVYANEEGKAIDRVVRMSKALSQICKSKSADEEDTTMPKEDELILEPIKMRGKNHGDVVAHQICLF
jgi:N-6 DNA Methylase